MNYLFFCLILMLHMSIIFECCLMFDVILCIVSNRPGCHHGLTVMILMFLVAGMESCI